MHNRPRACFPKRPLLFAAGLAVAVLYAPLPLAAQDPDEGVKREQPESEEKEKSAGIFRWGQHPSLRFGKILRIDFRAKFQLDFRDFTPPQKSDEEDLFDLHRARVGIEGRFLKDFEFEVEAELLDDQNPWRDVYVNYRHFRKAQIRAGKFKIPFGLEQLTGPTQLDMIFRTRMSQYLAPARSIGTEVHGRFFDRGLNYQVGFFRHDGENAFNPTDEPSGQRTFAGRLTGTPLRLLPLPGFLKNLELGQAFTESAVPPGLKGLRGRTTAKRTFFDRVFVHGHRLRLGSELRWVAGPFSIKSEFMHVRDQRIGQGILGQDLPDLIARGWYLTGTWVVTGEHKAGGVQPRKSFLTERGLGAIELAARYEQLRFYSAENPGRPSSSPFGANQIPNSDRVWNLGLNWYLNRWIKVQANAMRDKLEDPLRYPQTGHPKYWVKVLRVQFVL